MASKKPNPPKAAGPKAKPQSAAKAVTSKTKAVVKKAAPEKKAVVAKKAAPTKPAAAKKTVEAPKPAAVKKVIAAPKAAVEKKAAPEKKAVPAKKPVSPVKAAPAKKAEPVAEKKVVTKVVAAKTAPVVSKVVEVEVAKPALVVAPEPAIERPAVVAPPVVVKKSSLVDFPVPPAPVKPPFVPPKPTKTEVVEDAAASSVPHSAEFIQKQKQRLLDLRDDLVDAMSGMTRDTIRNGPEGSEASGSGQHQGDAGSDAYDRDFALSVLAKEQDALYEIEQALRRIVSGTYGVCEISNRKIPQARLEAIPFARLTVGCQAQWEKEYGKRRFRPSNEVGFSGGNYLEDEDSDTVSLDEDED